MGKDTTSNQGRAIATRGTRHYAVATPATDVCHPDGKPELAAPYENHIGTSGFLEVGTNSQTVLISGYRIWIDGGRVGEIGGWQSNPPHPPAIVALTTGQHYRREAWNTSCSDDLMVEGLGVVRTDDGTKQNFCNCDGKVDGSQLDAAARTMTDLYFKQSCKVVTVLGKSGDGVLGKRAPTSQEWNFLDVFAGDSVELESVRHTIRAGVHTRAGTCQLIPSHTHWKFQRQGGDIPPKEETKNGDKVTIGSSLTSAQTWEAYFPSLKLDVAGSTAAQKVTPTGGDAHAGAEVDWTTLVTMWRLHKHPAWIDVTAESCGATKNALLRIKPKGAVVYKFFFAGEQVIDSKECDDPPSVAEFFRKVRELKRAVGLFSAIAGASGISMKFALLEGFSFRVQFEYKRCEKEGITPYTKQEYTKAHIRPAWQLAIGAEPLIFFEIKGSVMLVTVVGSWCPPAAYAAEALARKFELGVFVEVGVTISCSIAFQLGQDQHEEFIGATGVSSTITISPFIKLSLKVTSAIEAWVALILTAEPKVLIGASTRPGTLLQARYEGKVGVKIQFGGRAWIFEATKEFELAGWEAPPMFTYYPAVGN